MPEHLSVRLLGAAIMLIAGYMLLVAGRFEIIQLPISKIHRSENPTRFWFWILVLIAWFGSALDMTIFGKF